ncbi:MAG: DinB family protein [Chloroflexi bacterium]|nr:DinB family protein [Chloroflexota bacterium]
MKATEFILSSVQGLHQVLLEDMRGLTQEHLAWRPQPGANPIGWTFLHYLRAEDSLVHRIQGRPPIWGAEEWQRAVDAAFLGPGHSAAAAEIDKPARVPLAASLAYAQQVMDHTQQFLTTLDESKLDQVPDPQNPRRTIAVAFRALVLAHGWWHLGEIKYLKGLQGMPSRV